MARYYVDFSTWIVEADNEQEAEVKALNFIRKNTTAPYVSSVQEVLEDGLNENYRIESFKIKSDVE
mgnify:FL=1|tara:strand:- start:2020 stop:2217 length:198 start_codon:yes stop_codon:yes gene_type:complete